MDEEINRNYAEVNRRIEEAAKKAGRRREDIHLVVVTKMKSPEKVLSVIEAGADILGENYPEETHKKIVQLGDAAQKVEWHMIGHLQSRKIKFIVDHFSMIHSIDSIEIARELNLQLAAANKRMTALFEVNVSGEESKHGFPAWDRSVWPSLVEQWAVLQKEISNLSFVGLMTMPPYAQNAEDSREYFKKCRELLEICSIENRNPEFTRLSMGTSLDYEVAIEEGATYVRIGEAIMGKRDYV